MHAYEVPTQEPTLLESVRRYWWLVVLGALAGGGLAYLYATTQPTEYVATASLIVEDPRAESLSGGALQQNPSRYVADQVAIIESSLVAESAIELAEAARVEITSKDIQSALGTATSDGGNEVEVTFRSSDATEARIVADAVIDAYVEVRRSESLRNFATALEQLDESITALDEDLATVQSQVTELTTDDPLLRSLTEQYRLALARLIDLQQRPAPLSAEALAELSEDELLALEEAEAERLSELEEAQRQLQNFDLVREIEASDPEIEALVEEQRLLRARRDALARQRDQVRVDAEIAGSGVVLISSAGEAEAVGPGAQRTVGLGVIFGTLLGAAGAYLLSLRRRLLISKLEPEAILGVPLIADVPHFAADKVRSNLPVRTAPASASAEAFRFIGAALRPAHAEPGEPVPHRGVYAITSALPGDGKTTVTVNAAFASARQGLRVLVVDADFAAQDLTKILLDGGIPSRGLAQVLAGHATTAGVVETIEVAPEISFDLLSRGSRPASASDLFRSAAAREFFQTITYDYDLVLIDTPAMLATAYASNLSSYADRAVAVVPHRSSTRDLQLFRDRLDLVGTQLLGYVYNRAPMYMHVTGDDGSMLDERRRRFWQPAGRRE